MRGFAVAVLFTMVVALAGCGGGKPGDTYSPPPSTSPTPGGGAVQPITIKFTRDESSDRLQIAPGTASDADWNRVAVKITSQVLGGDLRMGQSKQGGYQNEDALQSGEVLTEGGSLVEVTDAADLIDPNSLEFVEFCAFQSQATDVVIEAWDSAANVKLSESPFTNVAACP